MSEKVGKMSEKVGKPSKKDIFSDDFPMFHPHDGNLQHWQCKFISYASDGIFQRWKWKLLTNFDFSNGFFYSVHGHRFNPILPTSHIYVAPPHTGTSACKVTSLVAALHIVGGAAGLLTGSVSSWPHSRMWAR